MTQSDNLLDPEVISEVLGSLEDMNVDDIPGGSHLVGSVMSDAAFIIRALAEKAGVKIL